MSKKKISESEQLAIDFNQKIYKLIDTLREKNKNKIVDDLKKRVLLAAGACSVALIEAGGSYMYKYKEKIYAMDEQFFLTNNILNMEKIKDSMAVEIIHLVMNELQKLTQEEKMTIYDDLFDLMEYYIKYTALTNK